MLSVGSVLGIVVLTAAVAVFWKVVTVQRAQMTQITPHIAPQHPSDDSDHTTHRSTYPSETGMPMKSG